MSGSSSRGYLHIPDLGPSAGEGIPGEPEGYPFSSGKLGGGGRTDDTRFQLDDKGAQFALGLPLLVNGLIVGQDDPVLGL